MKELSDVISNNEGVIRCYIVLNNEGVTSCYIVLNCEGVKMCYYYMKQRQQYCVLLLSGDHSLVKYYFQFSQVFLAI